MTFTVEELSAILRVCSETGVRSLKLGDLNLTFGRSAKVEAQKATTPATPVQTMTESAHIEQTRTALIAEEIKTREQQVAELLLTDPLAAEQMISEGELIPDDQAYD